MTDQLPMNKQYWYDWSITNEYTIPVWLINYEWINNTGITDQLQWINNTGMTDQLPMNKKYRYDWSITINE